MMTAGIVGAGIMGRLLAFNLVQAGWQVTVFDQHAMDAENVSCSQVAAGLLTPSSELDRADASIFQLGRAALDVHWPNILNQLPETIYFQRSGSLALAHPGDQAELTHFIERVKRRLVDTKVVQCSRHLSSPRKRGSIYEFAQASFKHQSIPEMDRLRGNDKKMEIFGAEQHYQKLTQNDIQQLEPELTKFQTGYYFPDEGHIDSQMLFHTLGKYLQQQGVKWHAPTRVETVAPYQISFNNALHTFDMVFDCRGLGAKSLFADLRGIRGELIWLNAPSVNITRPIRFLHPRYSLYISPRPQNIYLVGASEIESEDMRPVTVKTSLELLTTIYYLHPGFGEAHIIKMITHCRPTLSDHLPVIRAGQGLIAINGLYRHGYLIAPALAHDVLQWLNQGMIAVNYPIFWETL